MKIRHAVETVATSNADDAAYLALEDVARITEHLDDVRVVGGHTASLLLTASSGARPTRTPPSRHPSPPLGTSIAH